MLLQFEEWIIISNYALNFIIFNIRLVVYSSSILSQLYPSSPTVSTFSGECASCHLWFCASLLFCFVCLSFCVCAMPFLVLSHYLVSLFFSSFPFELPWCFGRDTAASVVLAGTDLDPLLSEHWGEEVVTIGLGSKIVF